MVLSAPVAVKPPGSPVRRAAFGERRKTLVNALSSGLGIPRDEVERVVKEAGVDPRLRGERLGLEEFNKLADLLIMRPGISSEGDRTPGSTEDTDG